MTDVNFPQDFYLDDVGVWRLKKEKLAELEKPKPMTNEEYLRSLNTEQLADWLAFLVYDVICKNGGDSVAEEDTEYWMEWLKEKHTTKE